MAGVQKRHGDKWIVEDCNGKVFRIRKRRNVGKAEANYRRDDRSDE